MKASMKKTPKTPSSQGKAPAPAAQSTVRLKGTAEIAAYFAAMMKGLV